MRTLGFSTNLSPAGLPVGMTWRIKGTSSGLTLMMFLTISACDVGTHSIACVLVLTTRVAFGEVDPHYSRTDTIPDHREVG